MSSHSLNPAFLAARGKKSLPVAEERAAYNRDAQLREQQHVFRVDGLRRQGMGYTTRGMKPKDD